MDGLLTPVSSYRINEKPVETIVTKKAASHSAPKSPEDALEVLRHEPDYESLVSTLRFLSPSKPGTDDVFGITRPGPLSAQIVQVLVSEIVPNYWALLKEDSHGAKASSPFRQLLSCLRSITGINSIIIRLRALLQETKPEAKGAPKRSDVSLNVGILLDLLCHILEGDGVVYEIWGSATAFVDNEAKLRPLAHELVAILGSGRILSLCAEAADLVTKTSNKKEANSDKIWLGDALKYTKWLGRNIVSWLESEPAASHIKVCSELFVKALQLGHSELLVKNIFLALVSTKDARFRLLLEALRPTEQRKILYSVLRILSQDYLSRLGDGDSENSQTTISSAAGAISNIIGLNNNLRGHLVEWLTNSSGAGLGEGVGIRRAVIAVVAQDKDSIITVLEKSISHFGDQLYIKHSPTLQQEAHAQVLLLSAGYVHRNHPIKLTLLMRSSAWLNTISNRLSATNQRAHFLGMVVGEALSSLVDKGDKRLDFDIETTKGEEGKWYKGLTQISDKVGPLGTILSDNATKPATTSNQAPRAQKKQPSRPTPGPKLPQKGFVIEELSDEELEDDDLPSYAKPDSDEEDSDDDPTLIRRDKPKAPVYIRDLITYLRDLDSYDHQRLALTTAPVVIRRKAGFGTEVSEHAEELASLLVALSDKFEIENFDDLRAQGMVALIVAQPKMMAPWFAKTFFDGDYSTSQRASILVVLGLAARELAGFETSTYATGPAAFPSKQLPERVERLFLTPSTTSSHQPSSSLKALPANALETVAKSLTSDFLAPLAASAADSATGPDVLKLSTFTSRLEEQQNNPKIKIKHKARPKIRQIPNTTAQLLYTSFFSPLIARFQAALHTSSSSSRTRGILFHPYLLSLYLKTLALLIHACGPSTLSLPEMTSSLWRLLLSTTVRAHAVGDLPVTQAILFGLLAMLDVNENRMRDVCQEMGKEVVEAQEWAAMVFQGLRGGDGAGEEADVKMLAAGVLVRLREEIEKFQMVMVGDLIGFG